MLQSIHVKNLALIEETEVEFGRGLNILTGETGAGKSVLIGSVNLALGGKFEKDMLRRGAESALVELIFSAEDEKTDALLRGMGLLPEEDGTVIISRRLQAGKSVYRINGETVTARQVRELAELLIDIHGQHEHESLLHRKKHMEILDAYAGEALEGPLGEVAALYGECRELSRTIEEETVDESAKAREQSLAEFECREIEEAGLKEGEDEELEQRYRLMVNGKRIAEALAESHRYTGTDGDDGAGSALSRALRALRGVSAYDQRLAQLEEQLVQVDSLLADYNRDAAEYRSDMEFDGADFSAAEERLNEINRLKGKYGATVGEILAYEEECRRRLEKLNDYDAYIDGLTRSLAQKTESLEKACGRLSALRRKNAEELAQKLKSALVNLNFLSVEFEIAVRPGQTVSAAGSDEVEFLISTNPGEALKPLAQVASGGELSRVMLAIKTVLAERDAIDTLIFDEIDAGISGRTAWRVSEQLDEAARVHQVICITHLPQIAAMADSHFVIEKSSTDDGTITDIRRADGEESLGELARLLGSDTLSEAALSNARDMKEQAARHKASAQGG